MTYDIAIIGAGIVGLSTAFQLKKKSPDLKIIILEKEDAVAKHQTGNNSGVIHSGIYYKPGSLKAENCIRGYKMIVDFAEENNIPYELCGKIIVASDAKEIPMLHNIYDRGVANGLQNLTFLEKDEMKEVEPHVKGIKGIRVPQTGIIDYKAMSRKLEELLRSMAVDFMFKSAVTSVKQNDGIQIIETEKDDVKCRLVVNCAGLYSDKVARMTNKDVNMKIVPFRGEYFKLKEERKHLVKHLIYPVPDPNFPFLGVHFTRMIDGAVEAGPNAVLAFSREGYTKSQINLSELAETLAWPGFQKVAAKYWKTGMGEMYRSFSKSAFTKALQKLIPEIQESDLIPGGAGVRAQACDRDGGLLDDFLILKNKGAINVCNAPSPAATSSLSIGITVADKVLEQL